MKAFLIGMVLLVGVTAAATVVLNNMDYSAQAKYAPDNANVRLN